MCKVVNVKQERCDVYCGRGRGGAIPTPQSGPYVYGEFGNHFVVGTHGARGECVRLFADWFKSDDAARYRSRVKSLIKPGMTLGCFCKPLACHCDVIAAFIQSGTLK